jgi:integrase
MGLYKRGEVYWLNCTIDGRRYQLSTDCPTKEAAQDWAAGWRRKKVLGEVGMAPRQRFMIAELLDRLKQRWEMEDKATRQNLCLLKRTKADWGTKWADEVTASDFERYAVKRRKADYANASTNRIFQALRRSFNLAGIPWPEFELLTEDNRRTGFFSSEQMQKVLANLPDDGLVDYVNFCWSTGIRKSEAASLRWSFIEEGQIVVPPEYCKSDEPHTIPIAGTLAVILKRREAARSFESNGTTQLSEFIFHRGDGQPIEEFRKSWKTACTKAGCGNRLFHDLRRSFCRDAIRGGTPQSVAMALSGHRTISIFLRYDISADEDKKQALEKTAAYRAG